MTNRTNKTKQHLIAWAPYLALMATIVGAAWGSAWSLSGSLVRLEGKVESNAQAIERNAQAIERNARAIERNAQAIAVLQEAMANLTGQYVEHARRHDEALASR